MKLIYYFLGKVISNKLKLREGGMDKSKKWYLSKTIWSAIVTVLVSLYNTVGAVLGPIFGFNLPAIPDFVFAILGALIGYTRATATKSIQ